MRDRPERDSDHRDQNEHIGIGKPALGEDVLRESRKQVGLYPCFVDVDGFVSRIDHCGPPKSRWCCVQFIFADQNASVSFESGTD